MLFLVISVGNDHSMFDTPGLLVPMQLTNRLLMDELSAVLPQRRIEHVTYRIPEGSCVHLGAMCRLENTRGKPFFMTVFVGNKVCFAACLRCGSTVVYSLTGAPRGDMLEHTVDGVFINDGVHWHSALFCFSALFCQIIGDETDW